VSRCKMSQTLPGWARPSFAVTTRMFNWLTLRPSERKASSNRLVTTRLRSRSRTAMQLRAMVSMLLFSGLLMIVRLLNRHGYCIYKYRLGQAHSLRISARAAITHPASPPPRQAVGFSLPRRSTANPKSGSLLLRSPLHQLLLPLDAPVWEASGAAPETADKKSRIQSRP